MKGSRHELLFGERLRVMDEFEKFILEIIKNNLKN